MAPRALLGLSGYSSDVREPEKTGDDSLDGAARRFSGRGIRRCGSGGIYGGIGTHNPRVRAGTASRLDLHELQTQSAADPGHRPTTSGGQNHSRRADREASGLAPPLGSRGSALALNGSRPMATRSNARSRRRAEWTCPISADRFSSSFFVSGLTSSILHRSAV